MREKLDDYIRIEGNNGGTLSFIPNGKKNADESRVVGGNGAMLSGNAE